MHILEREITINQPSETLWEFIATPKNLNLLTPPELDFKILSDLPEKMYNGLTILYEIHIPLFGRKRWLTEIKHIREGVSFVDEQRIGPYRLWYHYHQVESLGAEQTRMLDRVHYRLPLEPLSSIVHELKVKSMLADIFNYREEKLRELFS